MTLAFALQLAGLFVRTDRIMGEFLKGWRRKAGCGTLAATLFLQAAWIRTMSAYDLVCVPRGRNRAVVFISGKSRIYVKIMYQDGLRHVFHRRIAEGYTDRDDTTYLGKDVTREIGGFGFLVSTALHSRVDSFLKNRTGLERHSLSTSDVADRIINLEMAVAHLEHELGQMHSVLLAVQTELKASRDQISKLERRVILASEPHEDRDPLDERPPHY